MSANITIHQLSYEQWTDDKDKFRAVGFRFATIHPVVEYCIPIDQIDKGFGPYGQAWCPFSDEPAELRAVCWADGGFSYCKYRWRGAIGDGLAKTIHLTTINGDPIVSIHRKLESKVPA